MRLTALLLALTLATPVLHAQDRTTATTAREPDAKAGGAFAGVMGVVCIGVGILAAVVVYFAPTLIALLRGHPNMAPIVVVNFFLGWSVIGWVVALAWAFSAQERHRDDYGRSRR